MYNVHKLLAFKYLYSVVTDSKVLQLSINILMEVKPQIHKVKAKAIYHKPTCVTVCNHQASVDRSVVQLSRSGDSWSTVLTDLSLSSHGLHFIIARNSQGEEKYPLVITVRPRLDLTAVQECSIEDGSGNDFFLLNVQ